MKLVYTNENRFIVGNAKNILTQNGIEVILKNEFASGGVGELTVVDAWVELWVVNDDDHAKANSLITTAFSEKPLNEWCCNNCQELNDASFEYCWNCQRDNS